jgi:hypothetical protein
MLIDARCGREAGRFVVAMCQPWLVAAGKLFVTVLD